MPTRPTADHAGPTYHVVNRAVFGQLLYGTSANTCLRPPDGVGAGPVADRALRVLPDAQSRASAAADTRGARHERLHASADDDPRAPAASAGAARAAAAPSTRADSKPHSSRTIRISTGPSVTSSAIQSEPTFVERVEDWMWSSASPVAMLQGVRLASWPLPRPQDWQAYVNDVEPQRELDFMRAHASSAASPSPIQSPSVASSCQPSAESRGRL